MKRIGLTITLLGLLCWVGPWLSPYGFLDGSLQQVFQGPSFRHPLGTDELGRDVLTRVLYGGRISLSIALAATLLAGITGVAVGLTGAMAPGWVGAVLMRLVDGMLAVPRLPAYLVLLKLAGSGLVSLVVVLALFEWPAFARLIFTSANTERKRDYVLAARALGTHPLRIALGHILPNAASVLTVALPLELRSRIMAEATLSFIGFGVQPPVPSWGNMISGFQSVFWSHPFLILYPGMAIFLTCWAFQRAGDAIQEQLG